MPRTEANLRRIVGILICLALTACATRQTPTQAAANGSSATARPEMPDPLEGANRVIFAVNDRVDRYALVPAARAYRTVVPEGARNGVRNVLANWRSPVVIGNQLLQGDLEAARNSTERFVINTLAGAGGLIDVAAEHGWPAETEDFGQTLGVWNVEPGFYLVLPLLGPSSLRDTAGFVVDSVADPVSRYLAAQNLDAVTWSARGLNVVDARSRVIEPSEDLRRNSVDYYAAMRSLYAQRRAAAIANQRGTAEIPDYSDTTEQSGQRGSVGTRSRQPTGR